MASKDKITISAPGCKIEAIDNSESEAKNKVDGANIGTQKSV
jgi:hypothetical protein